MSELPKTSVSFADLGLSAAVMKAVEKVGYESPSPIQAETIPLLLAGHDLIGQAQTGTGKTAAFALPILSRLVKPGTSKKPQAIVLAPTRELAIQVAEAFQTYGKDIKGFNVLPIYGGQDMRGQLRQLERGVQVVVGTPGRVMDHLKRKSLVLSEVTSVVLDEADEMLRMGFIDDVEEILSHTSGEQQTALFSATLPDRIKQISARFLKDPKHVKIKSETQTVSNIAQHFWMVKGHEKLESLTRLLEVEEFDGMIVFVRTKGTCAELAEKLLARGYACSAINGDMNQAAREKTIKQLKGKKIDILVATDVAARGLDVERISHVINYDIPYDSEAYVHRIGRTGRAGRTGKAIMFVTNREQRLLKTIERATKQTLTALVLPSAEELTAQRVSKFKDKVCKALPHGSAFFTKLVNEICEENNSDPIAVAAALAYLNQDKTPLQVKDSPQPERQSRERSDSRDRNDSRERSDSRDSRKPNRERSERNDSRDKNSDQAQPSRRREEKASDSVPMETFRLGVGHDHEVKAGDIVGAIANEIDLDSEFIGRIEINDDHSFIDLPQGMPPEIYQHLKTVRVKRNPLKINRVETAPKKPKKSADDKPKPRKPKS
jgi:ATP-dependent RNA helicase DeaD